MLQIFMDVLVKGKKYKVLKDKEIENPELATLYKKRQKLRKKHIFYREVFYHLTGYYVALMAIFFLFFK